MNEPKRQSVLALIIEHFGVDKYNNLVSAVARTLQRGKLRYWQDRLFSELRDKTGYTITGVDEYAHIFGGAPAATKKITLDEFLTDPSRYYYTEAVAVPDEWIALAWEQSDDFRRNVSYEYAREASKNGDIACLAISLRKLSSILPVKRSIELYCAIRDAAPHRESEFRPTFEAIFGPRMADFPTPLTIPYRDVF